MGMVLLILLPVKIRQKNLTMSEKTATLFTEDNQFYLIILVFNLSTTLYNTGTITNESNMELVIPPINTQPNPFFHSLPGDCDNAIGSIPTTVEIAVIRIGRILNLTPVIMALVILIFSERRVLIKC